MNKRSRRRFLTLAVAAASSGAIGTRTSRAQSRQSVVPSPSDTQFFLASGPNVHILTSHHTLLVEIVKPIVMQSPDITQARKNELREYCPSKLWEYAKIDLMNEELRIKIGDAISHDPEIQALINQSNKLLASVSPRLLGKLAANDINTKRAVIRSAVASIYHVERIIIVGKIVEGRIMGDDYEQLEFCEIFGIRVICGWLEGT